MAIFDGFAEGFAAAVDDIRHEVEIAAYGRTTTGSIELPQAEIPVIEPAQQEIEPPSMER